MKIKFRYKRFLGILLVCYLGIGFTSSEFFISSNDIKKLEEIAAVTSSNSNILILPIEMMETRIEFLGLSNDHLYYTRLVGYVLRSRSNPSVANNKYGVDPSFASNCNNFLSIVHPPTALPQNSSPEVNPIVSILPRTTRGANLLKFLCEAGKNLTVYQVSHEDYDPLTRFRFDVGRGRLINFYSMFYNTTIAIPENVWQGYLREDLCFRVDLSYFRRSINPPR